MIRPLPTVIRRCYDVLWQTAKMWRQGRLFAHRSGRDSTSWPASWGSPCLNLSLSLYRQPTACSHLFSVISVNGVSGVWLHCLWLSGSHNLPTQAAQNLPQNLSETPTQVLEANDMLFNTSETVAFCGGFWFWSCDLSRFPAQLVQFFSSQDLSILELEAWWEVNIWFELIW